jgi:hypothetical protein
MNATELFGCKNENLNHRLIIDAVILKDRILAIENK